MNKNRSLTETIATSNGNQYTFTIRQNDAQFKIKNLKTKIADKEENFFNDAKPRFEDAQQKFLNLITFTGYDLVLEWGIFDDYINVPEIDNAIKRCVSKSSPTKKGGKAMTAKSLMTKYSKKLISNIRIAKSKTQQNLNGSTHVFTPKNDKTNLKNSLGAYRNNNEDLEFKSRNNEGSNALSSSMIQSKLKDSVKLESSPGTGRKKKIVKRKKGVQGATTHSFVLSQSTKVIKKYVLPHS